MNSPLPQAMIRRLIGSTGIRLVLLAAVLTWLAFPAGAQAGPISCGSTGYQVTNFHLLSAGNSFNGAPVRFYNYDFGSPTCARANNVEWPIDLMFDNNASIARINSTFNEFYRYGGEGGVSGILASTAYARINDGAGTFWAHNKGKKSGPGGPGATTSHYRIYAYSQRNFTTQLGYFVIGSMHKDFNECPLVCHPTFGASDEAEDELWATASTLGFQAVRNGYDMRNEQYGKHGNHTFENDGKAALIVMP